MNSESSLVAKRNYQIEWGKKEQKKLLRKEDESEKSEMKKSHIKLRQKQLLPYKVI